MVMVSLDLGGHSTHPVSLAGPRDVVEEERVCHPAWKDSAQASIFPQKIKANPTPKESQLFGWIKRKLPARI